MNNDARGQWLSTTQAGAALRISARAVQKRCAAGTLTARRVPIPGGFKWEVDARELEGGTPEPNRAEPRNSEIENSEFHARISQNLGRNPRTQTPELEGGTSELRQNEKSERETEMKAEIAFLRNVVEAQQRDAVELRQALKRALDLAPKQLTAGATEAPPAKPEPQGKKPLTYNDIADEIERNLNR